jgi:hypothetical protein
LPPSPADPSIRTELQQAAKAEQLAAQLAADSQQQFFCDRCGTSQSCVTRITGTGSSQALKVTCTVCSGTWDMS